MLALSGTYAIFGALFANQSGAFRRAIQFFGRHQGTQPTVTLLMPPMSINDISRDRRVLQIKSFKKLC